MRVQRSNPQATTHTRTEEGGGDEVERIGEEERERGERERESGIVKWKVKEINKGKE